jgi:hypothetical protein
MELLTPGMRATRRRGCPSDEFLLDLHDLSPDAVHAALRRPREPDNY